MAAANPDCLYGAPVYEQDNRVYDSKKKKWVATRHVRAYRLANSDAVFYESGLAIDADGAPNAYHPTGSPPGLDSLSAAGYPTSCSVLVCVDRTTAGSNIYATTKEGPLDGFFVSMSTLTDNRQDTGGKPLHGAGDYRKYVDATAVPYIAVAGHAMKPFGLDRGLNPNLAPGELAYVVNLNNGLASPAIFADVGTNNTLGEGSIALAKALGFTTNQQSPKKGGVASGLLAIVFAHSKALPAWPREAADITDAAAVRFKAWGGIARVKACFPSAAIP